MDFEAKLLCRHLIGLDPNLPTSECYKKAWDTKGFVLDPLDENCLSLSTRFPWLIGFIDSGLAVSKPFCAYRQKIFIMSAVLETRPEYSHFFLPKPPSFRHVLRFIYVGFKTAVLMFIGLIFVFALRSFVTTGTRYD